MSATNTSERIALLIRQLLEEPDAAARSRICDEWAGAFAQLLCERGVEAEQAHYVSAQVMLGAILAADTLLAQAAREPDGSAPAVH